MSMMKGKQFRSKRGFVALSCLFGLGIASSALPGILMGGVTIAGYGPEKMVIEELARAFEKDHPGSYVDIVWHRNVKAVELVRSGDAQIAVTGHPVPGLQATRIAWDGIAIVVNFTNPLETVTRRQVADIFTGKIRRWSALDGPDRIVEAIMRPPDRNIDAGFKEALGINGRMPHGAEVIRSDQQALSQVSGNDTAVTYMSLDTALKARRDGIPIRILLVDRVEPEVPTVRDGRYKLRRPVLLLTALNPDAVTSAFLEFARSDEGQRILREQFVPSAPQTG